MKSSDVLFFAMRNFKNHKIQTLMIVISISFAVAVAINITEIVDFFYLEFDERVENNPEYKKVTVFSKALYGSNRNAPIEKIGYESKKIHLELSDLDVIKENVIGVNYAYAAEHSNLYFGADPWGRTSKKANKHSNVSVDSLSNKKIDFFKAIGTVNDFFPFYKLEFLVGSQFLEQDIQHGETVIVLGYSLFKNIYPKKKPDEILGKGLKLNGRIFKIIGVLKPVSDKSLFSRFKINDLGFFPITASFTYNSRGYPTILYFGTNSIEDNKNVKKRITDYFNTKFDGDYVGIRNKAERIESEKKELVSPLLVIIAMAASVLLMAAINMLNIMYTQILKRMKGISVLFCLGASSKTIFYQVISETLILYGIGALGGYGLSYLFNKVFVQSLQTGTTPLSITCGNVFISIGITLLIIILFSLYPVTRASKGNYIENIS